MSGWNEAKDALAGRLGPPFRASGGVAITAPVAQAIRHVYTEPPAAIESAQFPCIVFGESSLDDEWSSSLAREKYELTCSLFLRDEDAARAVELVEAYREAIKAKLRKNLTLLVPGGGNDTHAGIFAGPTFTPAGVISYGAANHVGCQFTVPVILTMPVTYQDDDL